MIEKSKQAAEARRILALHPKELALELAKLAAQTGHGGHDCPLRAKDLDADNQP